MIVITGAGGQLGRLVAEALAERVPPAAATLATRDPAKIADLAARGFRTVRADFDDPASLDAAFAGARTVLVLSGDAPKDVRIRQHRAAIDAAKKAGVGRIAYTSFTNATPASLFPFAWIHADTEAYLKASGVPYTILRDNQYAENLTNALARARDSGVLALPGAAGKVAYITRADIAAAIAGALTGSGHENRTYELTGSEALDLDEIAEVLARKRGMAVKAVDAGPQEFGRILASAGLPPFLVEALIGLYAAVAAGEYAAISQDAERLAGRPIEPVSAYVARVG
ncbi:SDR family oxidoreductase [Chelatococcus sp. SYSU_G07232]|uniref:SDR family oxidoreductase n=1 Tax=Chelatococcus albus TaxID=3047466 RepID=A0ABT7AGH7_9HYPH|nr:SDR family oxidoreductase [Chelatococcus sp. SYSU_G07232]MDJ1158475.1 SDR family oxidoreductase [Chelatococcus sp. SYSU_G07232]